MSLQLVSHALCPFVHRAAALLVDREVPFETKYIDLKAKPPWFLAISPRGKVPLLVVDETPLFESAPILEYLDETTPGTSILPKDPIARARQRAWIEVANDLFVAHYKLMIAKTPAELATARAALDAPLDRFEEALRADAPYFAGDTIGIVDYASAPALYRFHHLEATYKIDLFGARPKTRAWAERLASRASVATSVVPDFAERYHALLVEYQAAIVSDRAA